MNQIVQFFTEDGMPIHVQVDNAGGGMAPVARGDELVVAAQTLEKALDSIRPAAEIVIDKLRSLSQPPSSIEVVFGINLSATAGAVIATAGVQANYQVKLTWSKKDESSQKNEA